MRGRARAMSGAAVLGKESRSFFCAVLSGGKKPRQIKVKPAEAISPIRWP